jgi:Fic family protein
LRSGEYIKQPGDFRAFIPAPLPPDPPVAMDAELTRLLSDADRSLGRLDGIGSVLPNPDLFVAMYVRQEAVLSSQIEGTQSTLEDVLQFEVDAKGADLPKDIEEVVNYVRAMNYGLKRLDELPLSLRLIREIHSELLKAARGAHRTPGEFRRTQNWIGAAGADLSSATFVPPPVPEMKEALNKFEKFLHDDSLPVLIHCGLAHAQFETIHPFLDGNGRVGRLLITFLLCQRKTLHRPLLYLSHYLKANRAEYYDRLMAIRSDGNWEAWLKFFLRGVYEVSGQAIETALQIFALREEHRKVIKKKMGSGSGLHLLDYLYEKPMINIRMVERRLKISFVTANKLVEQFIRLEILKETTGGQRNRRYEYSPYVALFESSTKKLEEEKSEVQTTGNEPSGNESK